MERLVQDQTGNQTNESEVYPATQEDFETSFSSTISFSKLSGNEVTLDDLQQEKVDTSSASSGNRISDLSLVTTFVQLICCSECCQPNLLFGEINKKGSAFCCKSQCTCQWYYEFWSSPKSQDRRCEINKRFVYAMRRCGKGYAGLKQLCTFMDLPPPMAKGSYTLTTKKVRNAVRPVAKTTMTEAAQDLVNNGKRDENGFVDTAMSCDGSWQERGFSSLNGLVACISMDTGLNVVQLSTPKNVPMTQVTPDTIQDSAKILRYLSTIKSRGGSRPSQHSQLRMSDFLASRFSKTYGIVVKCSGHSGYHTAYEYVTKEDCHCVKSPHHPENVIAPKILKETKKNARRAQGGQKSSDIKHRSSCRYHS